MRKRIIYVIIIVVLLLTGCTIGGSFYMLNFSLTPDAKILSKDADSYPYMYRNYPFLRPWVDSLRQADALKDTFIINSHKHFIPTIYYSIHSHPPHNGGSLQASPRGIQQGRDK